MLRRLPLFLSSLMSSLTKNQFVAPLAPLTNASSVPFSKTPAEIIDLSSSLNFMAIGDWGASLSSPHALIRQQAVADGMASVFLQRTSTKHNGLNSNSPFILSVGDNFYPDGVSGSDEEVALRFEQSFEQVYSHEILGNIPWYVVAGNRDYEGNVTAQIAYGSKSSRWVFPDYFHQVIREVGAGEEKFKVEVIAIDTMKLHDYGNSQADSGRENSHSFTKQYGLKWIERHLSRSDADYLLVTGHYPIYAACDPVEMPELEELLQQYEVTAYIAGHDHSQGHIKKGLVNFFVSGTGMELCCDENKVHELPQGSEAKYFLDHRNNPTGAEAGFISFEAVKKQMVVRFHDEAGSELYETILLPRFQNQETDVHAEIS